MKKIQILFVPLIILSLFLFGCVGQNTNTFCGDSGLAQTLPTLTNSSATLVDRTQNAYACQDIAQMKSVFKGIESYVAAKYAYTDTTLCKSGNFCTNYVSIMKFSDRTSVDNLIAIQKQSAEHNGDSFYIATNGTNNVYYSEDGDTQNLYTVSWTSGNYLITIQLDNTSIVNGELRDKLLGKYPSDVTK